MYLFFCQVVSGLCICGGVLKDSHQKKEPLATDHHNGPGLLPLITVPKILLLLVTVSMAAISTGWLESLLSLYLTHQFSLSLSAVGLCFLLWSVVYTAGEDFSNLKLNSQSSSGSSLNSFKVFSSNEKLKKC